MRIKSKAISVLSIALSAVLLLTPLTLSAEQLMFDKLIDTVGEAIQESIHQGEINSINLVERSVDVSGYRFYLPSATDPDPLLVTMNGSAGALQLLAPGMFVEVYYIEVEGGRLGYEIVGIDQVEVN